MAEPIWTPSKQRVERSQLRAFMRQVAETSGSHFADYASLHRWSVEEPEAFWAAVWDFCEVIGERSSERVLVYPERMPGARWFPDSRLNFAENLLRRSDEAPALIFRNERRDRRELSYRALREEVAGLACALREAGIGSDDRVAGYLPNLPETVVAMLATTSLGAIWSSCSPDFGAAGVIDRFGQIEPKLLFCADGYFYAGKTIDGLTRIPEILAAVPSIERCIVIPYVNPKTDLSAIPKAISLAAFVQGVKPEALRFERVAFDHPLYIVYSSGTTGKPKCIVHGVGGSLLQHLKEHRLHADLRAGERFFYFTTCGWMMWNWLVSGLASGATLLLYDGSPLHPDAHVLFEMAEEEGCQIFGTSATFLDAVAKAGLAPGREPNL